MHDTAAESQDEAPHPDLARFARAFTEWDRRYREEPERFENEAARLLKGTPETYGEAAAPYFLSILAEDAPERQQPGCAIAAAPPQTIPTAPTLVAQIEAARDALGAVMCEPLSLEDYSAWSNNVTLRAAWHRGRTILAAPTPSPAETPAVLAERLASTHMALYLLLAETEMHYHRHSGARTPPNLHQASLPAYALLAEAARTKAAR